MSAVYIAASTAVVGLYSANKASSASKAASASQERAATTLANQADEAARLSTELGREQLAFAREQYQGLLPFAERAAGLGEAELAFAQRQYDEMKPTITGLAESMRSAQDEQTRQAREYYDDYRTTFRPIEQQLAASVQEFNTEAYREQLARQAATEAGRAFGVTQAASERAMASMGVNPASGRFAGLQTQNQLGLAAQRAGAMTGARDRAEQMGYARRLDVAGLGRGLPGLSTAAYSGATGAGGAAANTFMAPGNQYMANMAQGAGTTFAGLNARALPGNLYMAGMGQGAGTIMTGQRNALDAYSGLYGGATRSAMGASENLFGLYGSLVGMGGTVAAAGLPSFIRK